MTRAKEETQGVLFYWEGKFDAARCGKEDGATESTKAIEKPKAVPKESKEKKVDWKKIVQKRLTIARGFVKKLAPKKAKKPAEKKVARGKINSKTRRNYDLALEYLAFLFVIFFVGFNLISSRIGNVHDISTDPADGDDGTTIVIGTSLEEDAEEGPEEAQGGDEQSGGEGRPENSGRCNYGSAGVMPYSISIPSIGIHDACVEIMPGGDYLYDPADWNFGWYSASADPTVDGLGVYNCHTGFFGIQALCNNLGGIGVGSEIIVMTASGRREVFYVRRVEAGIDASDPMNFMTKLFTPHVAGIGGMNFLTCSGVFSGTTATERTIIYATK